IPLLLREASFGMLVVQSYRNDVRYTEADRDLLSYVSHHIAEAIDRQRKEDQIEHLAFHDGLTGLPNRLLFEDRLTKAIAQAERRKAPLSILFMDLDRFKVINDSLGHPTGDEVLRVVGNRFAAGLRDGDSLARRGGDEFLVLLPDTRPEGAALVAQKLIENVRTPIRCGGHDLTLSTSCGIAVFPENGPDAETLLKSADIAMYRAKEGGRDAYRLFNPDMNAAAKRRLTVETKLRRSIANRQIGPHFQPILDASRDQVVAAEALLRWSPLLTGTMPPKEFIPVAEQSGLILTLGAFVLREALNHARDWPLVGGKELRVSINFGARQIQDPSCVEEILLALRDAAFPPERLQLELSESAHITEDVAAVDRLRALKSEGISIAIDDFGVGYSSLSRLRHLPFDTLKLDGTLIKDMATDPRSGAVAGSVIALGQNLGLDVIAEGVETEAQKTDLLSRGCSLMQGFLFAAAMSPGIFAAWVRSREAAGR
ncbi:MAG: EAL domain-containing protein, partial [Vicinamibacteria bacterium]|nr:EAL domain-containing protein [Vicinamibacteria bacterium]